jgi:hypothetical protein
MKNAPPWTPGTEELARMILTLYGIWFEPQQRYDLHRLVSNWLDCYNKRLGLDV